MFQSRGIVRPDHKQNMLYHERTMITKEVTSIACKKSRDLRHMTCFKAFFCARLLEHDWPQTSCLTLPLLTDKDHVTLYVTSSSALAAAVGGSSLMMSTQGMASLIIFLAGELLLERGRGRTL